MDANNVSKRNIKSSKYLKRVIRKKIRDKEKCILPQSPQTASLFHFNQSTEEKNVHSPNKPTSIQSEIDTEQKSECSLISPSQSEPPQPHSSSCENSLPNTVYVDSENESVQSHMGSLSQNKLCHDQPEINNIAVEGGTMCSLLQENQLNNLTLSEELSNWVVTNSISHRSVNQLLQILNKQNNMNEFTNLPSDCRTLLKHKTNNDLTVTDSGHYYHFGIAEGLSHILRHHPIDPSSTVLFLDVNIDGLPLTKSSGSQFWPILGCFTGLDSAPFVIGIWHGFHKPHSSEELLSEFISEYLQLKVNGYFYNAKRFEIQISKIICDAPAKSFILGVKGHNSYFGCTKCITEGTFVNRRLCYNDLNCPLRTDVEFRSGVYVDDYQIKTTLLTNLDIDLVQNIPLDYMHLVCLGVMKRLIQFWYKGNISVRMNSADLELLNTSLSEFRNSISSQDFARLPRPITESDRWKATEFRQFLLYSGPLILKNRLKPSQYLHFVVLHCAIRILISPSLCLTHNSYAKDLLLYFVNKYSKLYGEEYVTHNVHNLIHLPEDVIKFGPLDNFSAFKFENYMSEIKKNVRSCNKPLEQIVNRFHEKRLHEQHVNEEKVHLIKPLILYQEPLLNNRRVRSYKYVVLHCKSRIGVDLKNNHCVLKDSTVIKVDNVIQCTSTGDVYIVFKRYLTFEKYFENPCGSDLFYCGRISNLSHDKEISKIDDILTKCLNYKNNVISLVV